MVQAWLSHVEDEALRAEYQSIVDELKSVERLIIIGPVMTRVPPAQVRRVLGRARPTPEAEAIAGYVGELVPDGATIQIGVGEPSMYLVRAGAFDGKSDLGLHTEMAAPGLAKLVEAGVINGSRKTLHPGKAVAGAWAGSDEEGRGIVAAHPRLSGPRFGPRRSTGPGAQPEAHIGAILSRGGRALTLLPSTALDGAVSRVVA